MTHVRSILVGVALALPNTLAAQWGQVTMQSPADGQHVTSSSVAIQFKGCSTVTQSTYQARVGSTAYSTTQTSISGNQCPDFTVAKRYNATGTLSPGQNTITGEICNSTASPSCYNSSITVWYDTPGLSIAANSGTPSAINDGSSGSWVFTVTNTGGLAGTVNLSGTCTGPLVNCSPNTSSVSLSPGAATSSRALSGEDVALPSISSAIEELTRNVSIHHARKNHARTQRV